MEGKFEVVVHHGGQFGQLRHIYYKGLGSTRIFIAREADPFLCQFFHVNSPIIHPYSIQDQFNINPIGLD